MRPDQRLRKAEHLTKPRQFELVYKEGLPIRGRRLTLLLRPNRLEINRIGISVSRRKAATIVQRNRLKRLVREAYRRNRARLVNPPTPLKKSFLRGAAGKTEDSPPGKSKIPDGLKGMDVLIIPAKFGENLSYKVIESELLSLFKRARTT